MLRKLALLVLAVTAVSGCTSEVLGAGTPSNPATETFDSRLTQLGVDIPSFARTESGVYYKDIRVGTGEVAAPEDQVTITYAGYLKDGTLFDSKSTPEQRPLATLIVQGFRDGVVGMRAGGRRLLVIPSALAYSWRSFYVGTVRIPRNATLVFDVELFAVTKPTPPTP
jgi:hypothetical protein